MLQITEQSHCLPSHCSCLPGYALKLCILPPLMIVCVVQMEKKLLHRIPVHLLSILGGFPD